MKRALTITELNDAVHAEFRRITGSSSQFVFTNWWAQREREVIRLQADPDQPGELAAARWAHLKRVDQQQRLLAYLAGMEPNQVISLPPREGSALRRVA